jgi:hypothetical protein
MITMSNARRQYAGPRKNRIARMMSFKQWARETFKPGQHISPKLQRILAG